MARIMGERISQYTLKSRTNRKMNAASPPRKAMIEATSQTAGMKFFTFISFVSQGSDGFEKIRYYFKTRGIGFHSNLKFFSLKTLRQISAALES
jgi:hypothetical protein